MPKITIDSIKEALFHTDDLIMRVLRASEGNTGKVVLLYLESMCSSAKIEMSLLELLRRDFKEEDFGVNLVELLRASQISPCREVKEAVDALLQGNALMYAEEANLCCSFDVGKEVARTPSEPENERSLVGNRDGFVEQLQTNLNLLRKHLTSGDLRVRYFKLGKNSNRLTAIVWLEGTADSQIVNEAASRLSSLSSSHDVNSGLLRKQLKEHKYSIFPQTFSTERVDFAASLLGRGKIGVLCDQSSSCLILPASLYSFMFTMDDLIQGTWPSLALRIVRTFGLLFGLFLPSLYIAIVGFEYEVLPFKMAFSIKSSLENVPYPPIYESFLMLLIFQIIAEATLRLPSTLAQMTGIVGGIIISESLVQIGFVSNFLIVITALTVIGKFAIPSNELRGTITLMQFTLVVGASIMGFYGIAIVFLAFLIHVVSMEPFGVPYSLPVRSDKQ